MEKTGDILIRIPQFEIGFCLIVILKIRGKKTYFSYTNYAYEDLKIIKRFFAFLEHSKNFGLIDMKDTYILTDTGIYLPNYLLAKYVLLDIDLPMGLFKINPYPEIKTEEVKFKDASIIVGIEEEQEPIVLKKSELYFPDNLLLP